MVNYDSILTKNLEKVDLIHVYETDGGFISGSPPTLDRHYIQERKRRFLGIFPGRNVGIVLSEAEVANSLPMLPGIHLGSNLRYEGLHLVVPDEKVRRSIEQVVEGLEQDLGEEIKITADE